MHTRKPVFEEVYDANEGATLDDLPVEDAELLRDLPLADQRKAAILLTLEAPEEELADVVKKRASTEDIDVVLQRVWERRQEQIREAFASMKTEGQIVNELVDKILQVSDSQNDTNSVESNSPDRVEFAIANLGDLEFFVSSVHNAIDFSQGGGLSSLSQLIRKQILGSSPNPGAASDSSETSNQSESLVTDSDAGFFTTGMETYTSVTSDTPGDNIRIATAAAWVLGTAVKGQEALAQLALKEGAWDSALLLFAASERGLVQILDNPEQLNFETALERLSQMHVYIQAGMKAAYLLGGLLRYHPTLQWDFIQQNAFLPLDLYLTNVSIALNKLSGGSSFSKYAILCTLRTNTTLDPVLSAIEMCNAFAQVSMQLQSIIHRVDTLYLDLLQEGWMEEFVLLTDEEMDVVYGESEYPDESSEEAEEAIEEARESLYNDRVMGLVTVYFLHKRNRLDNRFDVWSDLDRFTGKDTVVKAISPEGIPITLLSVPSQDQSSPNAERHDNATHDGSVNVPSCFLDMVFPFPPLTEEGSDKTQDDILAMEGLFATETHENGYRMLSSFCNRRMHRSEYAASPWPSFTELEDLIFSNVCLWQ